MDEENTLFRTVGHIPSSELHGMTMISDLINGCKYSKTNYITYPL